uniref:Uncharacterized protein n=1 Tax=Rhizophora mucronata TaxID=61149 RepID=A0A2P2NY68_RHIMU
MGFSFAITCPSN